MHIAISRALHLLTLHNDAARPLPSRLLHPMPSCTPAPGTPYNLSRILRFPNRPLTIYLFQPRPLPSPQLPQTSAFPRRLPPLTHPPYRLGSWLLALGSRASLTATRPQSAVINTRDRQYRHVPLGVVHVRERITGVTMFCRRRISKLAVSSIWTFPFASIYSAALPWTR